MAQPGSGQGLSAVFTWVTQQAPGGSPFCAHLGWVDFFFPLNLLFSFLCGLRVPRELQSSFNRNNTQSFILGYPEFCPSAAPPPNISFDLVFLFSYVPFCFYVSQSLRCGFSLCYSLSCSLCSLFATLLQQVQSVLTAILLPFSKG